MSTTRELHHKAMELFESALLIARDGNRARAIELMREALQMEAAAADSIASNYALEPTRSVLHRSAASIALKLSDSRKAMLYVQAGLQGNPPGELREELETLKEKALTLEAEMADYRQRAPAGLTRVQQIIRRFTSPDPPVNIIALADALGLSVHEAMLGSDISGEIYPDLFAGGSSGYSIRINASDPEVRKRFTVAHEVAHFLRHRDRINNSLIDDRMYRSRLGKTVEAEADQLAADLLMPRRLVGRLRQSGITSPEELAARFKVSTKAMKIRLGIKE